MPKIMRRIPKFFILGFLALFFLYGRPAEFGPETVFFQEFPILKPVVRIALGLNLEDVDIHASSGLKVYEAGENYKLLAENASAVRVKSGKGRWVMVNDKLVILNERTSFYFIPAGAQSHLAFRGKNYRGIFILRGGREGMILINILNLEDYLKGVVPGELSPLIFSEIEALKAQAIAARTYALKNIGQFGNLGFDLFATPQSQVYAGLSIEHPLSTRAVEETRGEVAVYDGQIINALYTSTCGGATENAEAIFEGEAFPYLQSTTCVMESEPGWTLRTGRHLPAYFVEGRDVSPKIAILASLGILAPEDDPDWLKSPIPPEEATAWVKKAALAVDKKTDHDELPVGPATPSAFSRWIEGAFGLSERVETPVGQSDFQHAPEDPGGLGAEMRSLPAYFRFSSAYPPVTPAALGGILTRAETAVALSGMIDFFGTPFRHANLKSLENNALIVSGDGGIRSLDLCPNPYLLRNVNGSVSFSSSLDLEPDDSVQWIEREGKVRLLQASSIPLSDVLDQPTRHQRWKVRTSREDLEARLNEYYPIGRLIDLVPRRRGASQRVIELSVIGRESQVLVTGLKIRQVLNLRDNLFVIDRETDEEGRPTHFIFTGRGWGHGVGLCQIGAVRMARNGATSEEILKTYYRGIKIEKRTGY